MRFLLDTGILLRLVNRQATEHGEIRRAVRTLKARGDETVISFQNCAEFWNVCTRPVTARGGLGLSINETQRRLRVVERIGPRLMETPNTYERWRNLVIAHGVQGVQVHDAKLVALMAEHGVGHILTLNARDFVRYLIIAAFGPSDIHLTA